MILTAQAQKNEDVKTKKKRGRLATEKEVEEMRKILLGRVKDFKNKKKN